MKKLILDSNKNFVVIRYDGDRGFLLLRSKRILGVDEALDIEFQDVRIMKIRSWFDSLQIYEVDLNKSAEFTTADKDMVEPGIKAYELISKGWTGAILAGALFSRVGERGGLWE